MAGSSPLGVDCGVSSDFVFRRLPQFDRTGANVISAGADYIAAAAPCWTKSFPRHRRLYVCRWRYLSFRIVRVDPGAEFVRRTHRGNYASRKSARSIRSEGGAGSR